MKVAILSLDGRLVERLGRGLGDAGVSWSAGPQGAAGSDVVLIDAALPEARAEVARRCASALRPAVVLVVGEDQAPPDDRLGADDFVTSSDSAPALRARLAIARRAVSAGAADHGETRVARSALRSTAQHFVLVDKGLRVIGSGGAGLAAAGVYLREPQLGEALTEAILPSHRALLSGLLERAAGGERNRVELEVRDAGSATPRFRDVALEPVLDEAGVPSGATIWISDDDARVQALLTLAQNEARFRALVQHSTDITSVFAADGTLLYASPTMERVTGRPVGSLVGRTVFDLIHPEDLGRLADHVARGEAGPIATRVRHVVGSWVHLESVLSNLLKDPNVRGIVVNSRDISERMRAAEALGRSERSFRTLIERAPESITVQRRGRIVYANPAAVALFGCDRPEVLVGRPAIELVHPDEREAARAREQAMWQTGEPSPASEERLLRVDGGILVVESIALRVDFDGEPAIVHLARDITGRKMMENRLLVADRMVSVGTLAAGVAHEINNPLAAVTANLRFLSDELAELGAQLPAERGEEMMRSLGDAREGAERVRVIVRDLKSFSRGNDDKLGPVDVAQVLESTANLAANEIRHRARLVKSFGPVPPVLANEARLGQVMLNLMLNAAQAIVEGAADKNQIRLATRLGEGGRVVIEVSDTGVGIPADNVKRLFDPFFTTKPVGEGTGLGLFVCHGIVTSMGGEITVDSEVGVGTTFRIALPAAPPEKPVERRQGVARSSRRGRILIVDDEEMILISVRRLLGGEHEVVALTSARDAAQQLAEGDRFDVILCDLMMPEMTGMDLHAAIKALAPEQAERMVFLTGGAFTPRARAFLDEVENPCLEKPFDAATLRALLRERIP